jgi:curli biogenesis system outer membrane secretion channel CsgG
MKSATRFSPRIACIILLIMTMFIGGWGGNEDPKKDDSSTSKKLESLPRAKGRRAVVTIYEFRSSVPEVSAAAATDMFMTALVKSGAFAVAERQRLNEGVMQEKQLNAQGQTTGDTANQQLAGAAYIFEGTVSEANAGESKTGLGGTVKGLGVETSGEKAVIGLDIRVIDAKSALLLDAINVRKPVKQSGFSVKGIGSFFKNVTGQKTGGADVSIAREKKEGVDQALRACIEQAIYELVQRYGK